MSASSQAIQVAGIRLTNPDRVLYAGQGTTKRDLAEYYRAVAHQVIPHLEGRPLTLVRCPRGQGGECFVQRRASESFPASIRRVRVPAADGEVAHLVVDTPEALIELVQLGSLELHTWNARRDRLERPDRMVLDLDPDESLPLDAVKEAALEIRARLAEIGLESYVKTTGGRGLHVVVPLIRRTGWEQVREVARALAQELAERGPSRFVAGASKASRRGKIYVDYLRNAWAASTVAAYSTRARPGAPVSVPLAWEELNGLTDPGELNVDTVPARLARQRRDPWEGYGRARQWITRDVRAALGIE